MVNTMSKQENKILTIKVDTDNLQMTVDTIILTLQGLRGHRVMELSQQSLIPEKWVYEGGDNFVRPPLPLSHLLAGVPGW